jgi:hypothetical protein
VVKAVVAVVGEGASAVGIRGIRHGSGLNQEDFGEKRKNSSTLEVACPPPGHRGKFRNVLQTITHPLTLVAVLVSNVESWMKRVPLLM